MFNGRNRIRIRQRSVNVYLMPILISRICQNLALIVVGACALLIVQRSKMALLIVSVTTVERSGWNEFHPPGFNLDYR